MEKKTSMVAEKCFRLTKVILKVIKINILIEKQTNEKDPEKDEGKSNFTLF